MSAGRIAYAVAACDKCSHFQLSRKFDNVVDQQGVGFLFSSKPKSGIKNAKLACWQLILDYHCTYEYHPASLVMPCLLKKLTLRCNQKAT